MISIPIPSGPALELSHLVLDYNGTLAVDGEPLERVARRLTALSRDLEIRVVTADTFGVAATHAAAWPVDLIVLGPGQQDERKAEIVRGLGADSVVAVGNGFNDALMLREAALGIVVLQAEGASTAALAAADIVVPDIRIGLDLLTHPKRLIATLRR